MEFLNWLKGAKTKAIVVLGSFAMLLGVGASVYSVQAVKQNEVVETKAASASNLVTTGVLSKVGIEIESNGTTSGANADYFLQTDGSSNNNTGYPGIKMLDNKKTGSHWVSITSLGGKNYTGYN